ncbi:hypothetical protein EMPS_11381 [Entomortierella parvispora]|uniref:Transcription factor TFIIIC triple barrel domain-containing protein n=1 Tax=Entomortierella parvispora TaxID=205924 RepID=A0A9P3HN95_9FUNG|nr:hypothetical protein EMPS_11381 [Entomortierella parvispora]
MTEPEATDETTYLSNAPDEIEAQFRDENAMDIEPLDDSESQSQDFEWVEESEYIILDFGGAGMVGKDMIDHAKAGYSLVGMHTPSPYFRAGGRIFRGFYDENAFTEDMLFDMTARKLPTTEGDAEKTGEELEEDDIEEVYSEGLDLVGIVTKRVIFEPVDLLPRLENEPILAEGQDPDEPQIFNPTPDDDDDEEERGEREHGLVSIKRAAMYAAGVKKVSSVAAKPSTARGAKQASQKGKATSSKLSLLQSTAPDAVAQKIAATRPRKKAIEATGSSSSATDTMETSLSISVLESLPDRILDTQTMGEPVTSSSRSKNAQTPDNDMDLS